MKYLVLLLFLAFPASVSAQADTPAPIREWSVPFADSRPRDPYVAPDGRIFFVGQRGHYMARLDPATGDIVRWDLPEGAGPHNVIVDREGMAWYAGNLKAHIGRLNPTDGSIQQFPMNRDGARDPHTLIFDRDGDIWFTLQGSNMIGFLKRPSGEVTLLDVATPRSRPYGIVMDRQDRPWFNLFGTNKLGMVDPSTMRIREFTHPRAEARTRRLGFTTDGLLWYVDYAAGYVGRLDPSTGEFKDWAAPAGAQSRPYAMAVDHKDRIWFVETGIRPNRFVRFDPATETFAKFTEVPSGGGTVRHMVFDAATRSIWFGADTNTIGRLTVED